MALNPLHLVSLVLILLNDRLFRVVNLTGLFALLQILAFFWGFAALNQFRKLGIMRHELNLSFIGFALDKRIVSLR